MEPEERPDSDQEPPSAPGPDPQAGSHAETGDGGKAAGRSQEAADQRVAELRSEFLSSLDRQAAGEAAAGEGGTPSAAAATAASGGRERQDSRLQAIEGVEEEEEGEEEEEEDGSGSAESEVEEASSSGDAAVASGAAAAALAGSSAAAAADAPSTSAGLQAHPVAEGLGIEDEDEDDEIERAIDMMLAAERERPRRGGEGAAGSAAAAGAGEAGDSSAATASLLGSLFSKLHSGLAAGAQLVGQHVKLGERSGVGGKERARMQQQRRQGPANKKDVSMRCAAAGAPPAPPALLQGCRVRCLCVCARGHRGGGSSQPWPPCASLPCPALPAAS